MADKIDFKTNAVELANEIARAAAKTGDLRLPFGLMARSQYKFEKLIFQRSGKGPYKDLSRRHKAWKKKKGFVYPILLGHNRKTKSGNHQGGRLAKSLLQPGGESILRIEKTKMDIGTKVPYAAVHQFGGGNNIPARPFLFVDEQRLRAWRKILKAHTKKAWR